MSFLRDGAQFIIKLAPAKEAHEAVLALRSTEDKKKTIFSLSRQFAVKTTTTKQSNYKYFFFFFCRTSCLQFRLWKRRA